MHLTFVVAALAPVKHCALCSHISSQAIQRMFENIFPEAASETDIFKHALTERRNSCLIGKKPLQNILQRLHHCNLYS